MLEVSGIPFWSQKKKFMWDLRIFRLRLTSEPINIESKTSFQLLIYNHNNLLMHLYNPSSTLTFVLWKNSSTSPTKMQLQSSTVSIFWPKTPSFQEMENWVYRLRNHFGNTALPLFCLNVSVRLIYSANRSRTAKSYSDTPRFGLLNWITIWNHPTTTKTTISVTWNWSNWAIPYLHLLSGSYDLQSPSTILCCSLWQLLSIWAIHFSIHQVSRNGYSSWSMERYSLVDSECWFLQWQTSSISETYGNAVDWIRIFRSVDQR